MQFSLKTKYIVRSVTLMAVLMFLFGCWKNNKNSADVYRGIKKYGIERGIIKYAVTGKPWGKEVLYFDRWGMREVRNSVRHVKIGSIESVLHHREIRINDQIININLDANTVMQSYDEILHKLTKSEHWQEFKKRELSTELIKAFGAKQEGEKTVLGKTCKLLNLNKLLTRFCLWHGVPLYISVQFWPFSYEMTATSIDDKALIDEKIFQLPKNVKSGQAFSLDTRVKSLLELAKTESPKRSKLDF
ncbi:MAG: hypothetical protein D6719_07335 [Candidatus Dadabacteria bacterium]|nr:MAG: hypothetical protein D6719_07335 [Candidatus Dadabacteria bacterium]